MSTTSSTDPAETLVDVLLAAPASDWPGSTAPDRIELAEESQPSDKTNTQRQTDVSLYVDVPVDGDYSVFSADGDLVRTHAPQVAVYTNASSTTHSYARAVVSIIQSYHADNETETAWVDGRPTASTDDRAQDFYYEGFAIMTVQTEWTGYDE